MKKFKIFAISLAMSLCVSGPSVADPSHMYGTWVSVDQQCIYDGGIPSSAAFTISRYKIEYFEQSCENLETPLVSDDTATVKYVLVCDDGIETQTQTTTFHLSDDDVLTVYSENAPSFTAKRCE